MPKFLAGVGLGWHLGIVPWFTGSWLWWWAILVFIVAVAVWVCH